MTAQEIANRLAEFESADEIAATLAVLGIKGKRATPSRCPLAQACGSNFGATTIFVTLDECAVEQPPAARDFILRFDSTSLYPELEAN